MKYLFIVSKYGKDIQTNGLVISSIISEMLKDGHEVVCLSESDSEKEYDYKGVIRADQKVFTTGNYASVYYGGAHGGAYEGGFAYNSQTGEAINFNDVVIKTDGLVDIITDELYENYDKEILERLAKSNWRNKTNFRFFTLGRSWWFIDWLFTI